MINAATNCLAGLLLVLCSMLSLLASNLLLNWVATTDPNNPILGYHILGDGVLVGISPTNSRLDTTAQYSIQYP